MINREHKFKLSNSSEEVINNGQEEVREEKQLDLNEATINDLRSLPKLLITDAIGVKGIDNEHTYLTSNGKDKYTRFPLKNTWTAIKP